MRSYITVLKQFFNITLFINYVKLVFLCRIVHIFAELITFGLATAKIWDQIFLLIQDFFIKDRYYRDYEGSAKGTPYVRVINVNRTLQGYCIAVGFAALQREMLGRGREVSHEEAKAYLDEMQDKGLVAVSDKRSSKITNRVVKNRCYISARIVSAATRPEIITADCPPLGKVQAPAR